MGFESGSISFRAFYLGKSLPKDHVKRFADHAAPPLSTLGHEPLSGWVTGRHLLDRHIVEETAYYGGYLRLNLMKAERRIPGALLRAECQMAELSALQSTGDEYIKREDRARIRKEVTDRLLPTMPPLLTGIPVIYGREEDMLFAVATSEAQVDALIMHFQATTGVELVPVTPQTAPLKRRGRSVKDLDTASFSADASDEEVADDVGLDFLTWLWFYSEMRGGELRLGQGNFAVSVEGPLTLVMEGGGAHEARLRNGAPLISMEAKTALSSGKKLRRARVHIVRGEQEWIAEVDGHEFVVRGLKLPKGEPLDAISRFQERMLSLRLFLDALLGFYDHFVDERIDGAKWGPTVKDMRAWVASRAAKR